MLVRELWQKSLKTLKWLLRSLNGCQNSQKDQSWHQNWRRLFCDNNFNSFYFLQMHCQLLAGIFLREKIHQTAKWYTKSGFSGQIWRELACWSNILITSLITLFWSTVMAGLYARWRNANFTQKNLTICGTLAKCSRGTESINLTCFQSLAPPGISLRTGFYCFYLVRAARIFYCCIYPIFSV